MVRVLVVDQNPAIRNAFQRFFTDPAVEVVVASDLQSGIHGSGGVADLIITDDLLGGIDEARAEQIRDRNFSTLTPVVGMGDARLTRKQWQEMGYSDYLGKPLTAVQVRETLAKWLPEVRALAAG